MDKHPTTYNCRKKPFPSRAAAKKAKKAINRKRSNQYKIQNQYFCETCQAWHVTSQDVQQSRKGRRVHDQKQKSKR